MFTFWLHGSMENTCQVPALRKQALVGEEAVAGTKMGKEGYRAENPLTSESLIFFAKILNVKSAPPPPKKNHQKNNLYKIILKEKKMKRFVLLLF